MGVASIGWAAIFPESKRIDCGVRVFPAGVDNFNSPSEKHPNLDRRAARGARRRIRRKAARKELICGFFQELGWMPVEEEARKSWDGLNVYELRSRAISQKISLPKLGRIILHINQRRGFLSLRKSEKASADKETQGMLGSISALQNAIDASGYKTLGNYLYQLYRNKGITERIRDRHTRRSMLHEEFSLIWETQSAFHPELTDALRYGHVGKLENPTKVVKPIPRQCDQTLLEQFGFENLTFFQRKVYWPINSIGRCELEPEESRAPVADRRFQEFRMLQEVNNLRLIDNSVAGIPVERPLTPKECSVLIDFLSARKDADFENIKKTLCHNKELRESLPGLPAQLSFNLESGGRTKISGMATDTLLAKAYGKDWFCLPAPTKNLICDALLAPAATDEDIRTGLESIPDLESDRIESLLEISLPTSYGHLCVKALEKLLPPMRSGMVYMAKDKSSSALHAAGYVRRDERSLGAVELLPSFQALIDPASADFDPHQAEINNPLVLRAITELRKVVNGVIRKYGKPLGIHLEMARDLKMSAKQRDEYQKRTRKFEKERSSATEDLESMGLIPNRDAIQLHRLWKEQVEVCIYSGRPITVTDLVSGDLDIDHIYPYSKSADDSMANKVLCFANENRDKGNRTPCQWLADSDPSRYEQILQRAKKLPHGRYKRFITREVPEGFVARDLNDTAWMARAASQYLARIFPQPHQVLGIKGAHTALLRDQWELHSLLRDDGLDLKNRDDHRHHALDAIVIALCNQSRIQALTRACVFKLQQKAAKESGKRIYHLRVTGDKLSPPWESFRDDAAASLNAIWVSHRPKHKISGPLHKETNYGKNSEGLLVIRKPVKTLSVKQVEGICDPTIKTIVKAYIAMSGGEVASLKSIPAATPLTMPSGIPIRKVRTAIPYAHITLRPGTPHETHVQSAATHHLGIFSLGDKNYNFEPVTLFEATRRLRSREPVVQKRYKGMPSHAEFLFYLCPGDSLMATIDGEDQLFVFNTVASTTLQVMFAHHTDAAAKHDHPGTGKSLLRSCKPSTFEKNFPNARKVNVLPTGEIRRAN